MYIGIDLGGTNVGFGIVDEDNKFLFKDSIPTRKSLNYEEICDDIIELIKKAVKALNKDLNCVKGVGIGVPGIVNPSNGMVIECVNLKWKNIPVRQYLEERLNVPVSIGNDATVAGVAEFTVGAMKGYNSGVLLTLGTGIGAGIIIDGKVYDGAHGIGSEIGHVIVGENFFDCNCGRNGCLETFCSSTAIIKYAQKLIEEGNKTSMEEEIQGDLNKINGKLIFDAAKNGDKIANEVVSRMVKYLAIGIVNTVAILDPEVIVIGGGLSAAGEFLLNKIIKEAKERVYFKGAPIGDIVLSKIGNDGGIIGAANLCRLNKK